MPRRSSVRRIIPILLALGAAGASASPGGEGAPDGATSLRAIPVVPRRGPLKWGLYQILWRRDHFASGLDREIAVLGRPDYVTFFRDLGRPYPKTPCRAVLARGAVPIISLELQHWGHGEPDALARIVAGDYDTFFTEYAQAARASGDDVWLRFGFEMNGDWFPWGCQPDRFVTAWRRAHDIFQRAGAANVVWVWAPNAISGPDSEENGMERYWPGDAYVDVIGLDGYNFGDAHTKWHRWCTFQEIFGPALEKIRASGVRHPVFISEFGCTHDVPPERRAEWIREAHAYLSARQEVVGALWFNLDKRREGEKNWRIDANDASLAAWRETFAAPAALDPSR